MQLVTARESRVSAGHCNVNRLALFPTWSGFLIQLAAPIPSWPALLEAASSSRYCVQYPPCAAGYSKVVVFPKMYRRGMFSWHPKVALVSATSISIHVFRLGGPEWIIAQDGADG